MFCPIRVEQFSREEVDLKLGVSLDFDVPMMDLSLVRQMMDSINVLPGQTLTAARLYYIHWVPFMQFYAIEILYGNNKMQIKLPKCA